MKTFNEKYALITYNPFWRAVVIKWNDFASMDEYQKALKSAMDTVLCFDCKVWVSDMSHGKAVPNAVKNWVCDEFIPQMAIRGIRKVAILLEGNAMRRLYAENIKESIQMSGMQLQIFNLRPDMEKWLKERELVKKPFVPNTQKTTYSYYY
jgi:hypothetical protein